jgi:predicted nucleotidyltransferase component of viral defense system
MPARDTAAGRAYNDLKNLARRQDRDVAEYFALYALEGFIARLAQSEFADQFVLKGGVLMAAFSARRPTRDIDLSATGFPDDIAEAEQRIKAIAAIARDDGLEFDAASIHGEVIRDEADYQGVRVHLTAHLAKARIPFHVDLNFGDPVWPAPTPTRLPLLLGGQIEVLGYPVPMALAEKIVTAIERGAANARWRDFADIATIANTKQVLADELAKSVAAVASHRRVNLKPLAVVLDAMGPLAQTRWAVWRRKQHLEDSAPEQFQDLLDQCFAFADPVLTAEAEGSAWSPPDRAWR